MVTFPQSLQSLELVHGLEELTVDCGLITQDPVDRRFGKRFGSLELLRFMPGSDTEPPVLLCDLFDQNLLQRAHWFQVVLQVV